MGLDFNYFLNRQGIQGKRGERGEQGFSPLISVKTQTASEYILTVQNEDGSFDTPNLRGNAIANNGGTYIRYNPVTEEMYTGDADYATNDRAGVVLLASYEQLIAGGSENLIPTSEDVYNFVTQHIVSGFVSQQEFDTYTEETAITLNNLATQKLSFVDLSSALVEGDNITLDVDSENKTITINAAGTDLSNYVTLDTNQFISGIKMFEGAWLSNPVFFMTDLTTYSGIGGVRNFSHNSRNDNMEIFANTSMKFSDNTTSIFLSEIAKLSDIPSPPDLSNYMTLDTVQTITARKLFATIYNTNNRNLVSYDNNNTANRIGNTTDVLDLSGYGVRPTYTAYNQQPVSLALLSDIPSLTGYATETWVSNQGYLTGITSGDVTGALGYTPYDSSNPNGYTSNIGTVVSVNNVSPDANGNVSITIPDTTNLANKSLSNLDTNGNKKLHALKGYFDELEELSDTEGYNDYINGINASKDYSMFTLHDTATISSSGVFSNSSDTGYASFNLPDFGSLNSWSVKLHYNATSFGNQGTIISGVVGGNTRPKFNIQRSSSDLIVQLGTNYTGISNLSISMPATDTDIYLKVSFSGSAYTLETSSDGITYTVGDTVTSSTKIGSNAGEFRFGNTRTIVSSQYSFKGSIYLDDFEVIGEGQTIFKAQKRGVDTYNVNGTDVDIPYIETPQGDRIADIQYLSAAQSVYGATGSCNEVILDTVNQVYYLPAGSIYGKINKLLGSVGDMETLLNGKADVDLSNINASQTAKNTIIGWGMPDYANKVSFSNNTTIQLPVDALVTVSSSNGGAGWSGVDLWIYDTDGTTELWYAGNTATYASSVNVYVPKGLYIKADVGGSSQGRFYIPLKGAN